ncbi:hypothetical protein PLICRDRAFT_177834 [Plicaturopsis crispa FD-325 SS-3]|nr:hypothetical protein PLICRDRAFT_177834 [Plicaturopsis crispa FD-325 SS-3]
MEQIALSLAALTQLHPRSLILLTLSVLLALRRFLASPVRPTKLPPTSERVLVLGASSGIGRAIAHEYASRGARVCIVGRNAKKVHDVVGECRGLSALFADSAGAGKRVLGYDANFADVAEMVRVRSVLEAEWKGLDTLIVAAGVSALQPVMAVAGVLTDGRTFMPSEASSSGIQKTVDVALAATTGNYIGPLVSAVTFIPLLSSTSTSPAVLLVSSLASVIPAPTRALYGSTKSAALVLYQALSIEHPAIAFSHVLPSTVEGAFRASAVDGGDAKIWEDDPNTHGLKREYVARRCIRAVDWAEKNVFVGGGPGGIVYRLGHFLYWVWPSYIEGKARRKYNFEVGR